jgi:hypothetical protein
MRKTSIALSKWGSASFDTECAIFKLLKLRDENETMLKAQTELGAHHSNAPN